ncbi:MAG: DNA mismatch endonuclease Vsr [Thermoguttaceae bacterium]
MADVFSSSKRSEIMRAVHGTDTKPEMIVRRLVHALGYRYRLHVRSLPGTPDIVFPCRKSVIFVHGCFWHRHSCSDGQSMPRTRRRYWNKKFETNKMRDLKHKRQLRKTRWKILIVWECQTKARNVNKLEERLKKFLG